VAKPHAVVTVVFDLQSVTDGYRADLCGGYQNATNIMQQTNEDHDIMRTLRPISETSRLLQHDGRSSVTYEFDRMNAWHI
jgi:hypothetical protein